MKNLNKKVLLLSSIVCLLPIVLGAVLYKDLPDQVVIHWNAQGTPDDYASKFFGIFVLPCLLLLLNLAMPFVLMMDPRYENTSNKMRNLAYWIIPAVSLFASGITLSSAAGVSLNVTTIACLFMGFLFVIIGNYMPKMAPSYMVGIKLPWTLNDDENWIKTHRLAGFLWVIGGFLIIVIGFLKLPAILYMVVLLMMVIIPTIYSFLLFKNKK